jgi:RNA polymerase sigma factor FliA
MSASPQPSKLRGLSVNAPGEYSSHEPIDRDAVIEAHIGLVQFLAGRMANNLPTWVDTDDLIGAGLLGLLDAVDKFDPSRCVLFKTYAEKRVRGAMLDSLRSIDWVPRSVRRRAREAKAMTERLQRELNRQPSEEEIAAALGLSPAEFQQLSSDLNLVKLTAIESIETDIEEHSPKQIPIYPGESPLALYEMKQRRNRVRAAIAYLPGRERQVVVLYYLCELSMSEVATELGVTVSRVSQIHRRAVKRLRAQLDHDWAQTFSKENIVRFSKSAGSRDLSAVYRHFERRSRSHKSRLPTASALTNQGNSTKSAAIAAA